MQQNARRYDLDWLRVIAFAILILFHTGMFFNTWDWHVKNPQTSDVFDWIMIFFTQWRMSLLFVISGCAVWFALQRYSASAFAKERVKRLLLPLIFGILVIVPPQIYFERVSQGVVFQSFTDFYSTVLQFRPYPEGNFSWHHLWYLPYIFVFSLIGLPLFRRIKTSWHAPVHRFLERLRVGNGILLGFLPLALSECTLRPFWRSNANNLLGDWAQFTTSFLLFCSGFILASHAGIWTDLANMRKRSLRLAILTTLVLYPVWQFDFITLNQWQYVFYRILRTMNIWFWIVTMLGFSHAYLNRNHAVLRYCTDAVYPLYILHQTITVTLGYFLIDWHAGILLKFAIVAGGTVFGSLAIYELLIRRWNILRPLFGLKPLSSAGYHQNTTTLAGASSL